MTKGLHCHWVPNRQLLEGYSHQTFQPSGGAAESSSPSEIHPHRFEMPRNTEDSFVAMNIAHDLDRVDNDAIVDTVRY